MKDVQIVQWFPQWHGFRFIKGSPLKEPSAFHLIYAWSICIGFWEIRKFLSDTKRVEAFYIWKHNRELTEGVEG